MRNFFLRCASRKERPAEDVNDTQLPDKWLNNFGSDAAKVSANEATPMSLMTVIVLFFHGQLNFTGFQTTWRRCVWNLTTLHSFKSMNLLNQMVAKFRIEIRGF